MCKYLLISSDEYKQEITENEYINLKINKNFLLNYLSIEEKLEFVLANYAEIERELFNITLNEMMIFNKEWSSKMDKINSLNLKIVNFLTTTRLYIDQVKVVISSIYGGKESEKYKTLEKKCSNEYDNYLSYRAIEAIRNHVQHYTLPVWQITKKINPKNIYTENCIQVFSRISDFEDNNNFKKKILNELKKNFGKKVNLILLIRQYLDSLGRIHEEVRNIITEDSLKCEKFILEKTTKQKKITLLKVNEENNVFEKFDIFCDLIERRKKLEEKNRYLTHYSFQYISTKILDS